MDSNAQGRFPIVLFTLTYRKLIQFSDHRLPASQNHCFIHTFDKTIFFTIDTLTYCLGTTVYHLLDRVGGGDISALRDGLIGSCS